MRQVKLFDRNAKPAFLCDNVPEIDSLQRVLDGFISEALGRVSV
jgi:hypothetical protein